MLPSPCPGFLDPLAKRETDRIGDEVQRNPESESIPTLSPAVQLRDSWLTSPRRARFPTGTFCPPNSATSVSGFPTTDHHRPWAILCLPLSCVLQTQARSIRPQSQYAAGDSHGSSILACPHAPRARTGCWQGDCAGVEYETAFSLSPSIRILEQRLGFGMSAPGRCLQACQGETHSSKFCRHPRRPDQVPCQVPALSGICSR